MTQRTERIDELLRQEIGEILTREVKDPAIGFATITDVETSPDLRHARVWVSVIGQKGERDATIAALQRAMSFVRRELGTRLRLRRIPELQVKLDDSIERGTRVLRLLDQLESGEDPVEQPSGESLPTPTSPGSGDAADAQPAQAAGRRRASRDQRGPGSERGPGTERGHGGERGRAGSPARGHGPRR